MTAFEVKNMQTCKMHYCNSKTNAICKAKTKFHTRNTLLFEIFFFYKCVMGNTRKFLGIWVNEIMINAPILV